MLVYIAYSLIVLLATTIGASAGIGGGIIIKPLFDLIALDTIEDISFLSANAVFFMSLYTSGKRFIKNQQMKLKLIIEIALSSIIGGYLGNIVFNILLADFNRSSVQIIQSLSLCAVVLFLIIYFIKKQKNKIKTYNIHNTFLILLLGLILGFISAFLSIGGGPLNIAIYSMFLGLSLKESVTYSLATILFAQGAQITNFAIDKGYSAYPYEYLFFIVPIAILGGILDQAIYKRSSENFISISLIITMCFILCVNVYNLIHALMFSVI